MKAGLTHSVGQASLGIRIMLALISLVTAVLCISGGRYIASTSSLGRALAVLLVMPIGFIVFTGAMFVLAPHARYSQRLDEFVPRLREGKIAAATVIGLWLVGWYTTR